MARRLLVLLAVAGLVAVPAARADGDPASDYLITQRVFLPFNTSVPKADQDHLRGLLLDGAKQGYPIRVALISSDYDLGSVTVLWKQPRRYAKFLARELQFVHVEKPILVVMPNGMGYYRVGRSPNAENALLAKIPVRPGGSGLAQTASLAVTRLAAARGLRLTPLKVTASSSHRGHDRIVIVAGVAVLLLLGLGARMVLRRRQPA